MRLTAYGFSGEACSSLLMLAVVHSGFAGLCSVVKAFASRGFGYHKNQRCPEPKLQRRHTDTKKCRKGYVFLQRLVERSWFSDMVRMFRQLNVFGQMDGAKCGDLQRSRC